MIKGEIGMGDQEEQMIQLGGLNVELEELHSKIESSGYNVEPHVLNSLMELISKVREAQGNIEAGTGLPPDLSLEALEQEKSEILQALNNQEE
jgi:hypothetical protein